MCLLALDAVAGSTSTDKGADASSSTSTDTGAGASSSTSGAEAEQGPADTEAESNSEDDARVRVRWAERMWSEVQKEVMRPKQALDIGVALAVKRRRGHPAHGAAEAGASRGGG